MIDTFAAMVTDELARKTALILRIPVSDIIQVTRSSVLTIYLAKRAYFSDLSDEALKLELICRGERDVHQHRWILMLKLMTLLVGSPFLNIMLCAPSCAVRAGAETVTQDLPNFLAVWPAERCISQISRLSLVHLGCVYAGVHFTRRWPLMNDDQTLYTARKASKVQYATAIYRSIMLRLHMLGSMEEATIRSALVPYDVEVALDVTCGYSDLCFAIIISEFGQDVVAQFRPRRSEPRRSRARDTVTLRPLEVLYTDVSDDPVAPAEYVEPQDSRAYLPVEDETGMESIRRWRTAILDCAPPPCAVCSRVLFKPIDLVPIGANGIRREVLDVLRPCSEAVRTAMEVSGDTQHGHPALDGLLLCQEGIVIDHAAAALRLCAQCHSSLNVGSMPQYALANGVYRGRLPKEFQDMTWVEELACSLYRTWNMVTRLYCGLDDDPAADVKRQPRVLSGNTCACDNGVLDSASVLPRTPANMRDLITVSFIGSGELKSSYMMPVLRVRKPVVWAFLLWSKRYNPLYAKIDVDPHILDQYPDDNLIPGLLKETFVLDCNASSIRGMRKNAIAGFDDHPTLVPPEKTNDASSQHLPELVMEKLGVADPNANAQPGRIIARDAFRKMYKRSDNENTAKLVYVLSTLR